MDLYSWTCKVAVLFELTHTLHQSKAQLVNALLDATRNSLLSGPLVLQSSMLLSWVHPSVLKMAWTGTRACSWLVNTLQQRSRPDNGMHAGG